MEDILETRWNLREISNRWKHRSSEVQLNLLFHLLYESWTLATTIPDTADMAIFQNMFVIKK